MLLRSLSNNKRLALPSCRAIFARSLSTAASQNTSSSIVIDKSQFILEVLQNNDKIQLIQRPMGWGKTRNMSLLQSFFQFQTPSSSPTPAAVAVAPAGGSGGLGVAPSPVATHLNNSYGKKPSSTVVVDKDAFIKKYGKTIYTNHCGKYEVVSVSFSTFHDQSFPDFVNRFKIYMSDLFITHKYLLDTKGFLNDNEREYFEDIFNRRCQHSHLKWALHFLTKWISRYHSREIVLLLDDHDIPILSSICFDYHDRLEPFYKEFMDFTFRDHSFNIAVVTGTILFPHDHGAFSKLPFHAFNYATIVDDQNYGNSFGILENEAKDLLVAASIFNDTNMASLKSWYSHPSSSSLVPLSVMRFVDSGGVAKCYNYGIAAEKNLLSHQQSSSKSSAKRYNNYNLFISRLLCDSSSKVIRRLESVYHGSSLSLVEEVPLSEHSLWNILVMSGYVSSYLHTNKQEDRDVNAPQQSEDSDRAKMKLKVSNLESKEIIRLILSDWLNQTSKNSSMPLEKLKETFTEESDSIHFSDENIAKCASNLVSSNYSDFIASYRKLIEHYSSRLKSALVLKMNNLHDVSDSCHQLTLVQIFMEVSKLFESSATKAGGAAAASAAIYRCHLNNPSDTQNACYSYIVDPSNSLIKEVEEKDDELPILVTVTYARPDNKTFASVLASAVNNQVSDNDENSESTSKRLSQCAISQVKNISSINAKLLFLNSNLNELALGSNFGNKIIESKKMKAFSIVSVGHRVYSHECAIQVDVSFGMGVEDRDDDVEEEGVVGEAVGVEARGGGDQDAIVESRKSSVQLNQSSAPHDSSANSNMQNRNSNYTSKDKYSRRIDYSQKSEGVTSESKKAKTKTIPGSWRP